MPSMPLLGALDIVHDLCAAFSLAAVPRPWICPDQVPLRAQASHHEGKLFAFPSAWIIRRRWFAAWGTNATSADD